MRRAALKMSQIWGRRKAVSMSFLATVQLAGAKPAALRMRDDMSMATRQLSFR